MISTSFSRITLAVATLALAACSSTKLAETADVKGKAVDAPAAPAVAQSSVAPVVADHLNPNSLISKERSVYFDFDQFVIKASDGPLIERQGKYLASKPTLAIRVEGNADERGGREYNLALGQKRADAMKKMLLLLGGIVSHMPFAIHILKTPAAKPPINLPIIRVGTERIKVISVPIMTAPFIANIAFLRP